jgi:hypothetical protein
MVIVLALVPWWVWRQKKRENMIYKKPAGIKSTNAVRPAAKGKARPLALCAPWQSSSIQFHLRSGKIINYCRQN